MRKMLIPVAPLLMLFLSASWLQAKEKIERVEPSFWWTGMKNQTLQIMVYGENISELKPEINYPGVKLEKTVMVKSPNYLFIYLTISKEVKPGPFDLVFTRNNKTVIAHTYHLYPRENGSAERTSYDPSDVMILITPDRFANGDPSNDNIKGFYEKVNRADSNGRHGGDIKGIIDHLDYLHDMGFTALWINPLLENNQKNTSYHGYAITDFYKTDARFGSNELYKELAIKSKEKGIKLIMDVILNHCGSEHWWIKDLPTENWLNFQNKWKPTSHRRETIQDPYVSDYDKQMHADGWFAETMPDLNQRNELLADYLIQNSIWWVEYAHLSGIRIDTYPYPDKDFMAKWTYRLTEEYPNLNMVGEEWTNNPSLISFWQKGKINSNGYTSALPGLMDFPLQTALTEALIEDEKQWGNGLIKLYAALANDFIYADPSQMVVFPDNHDMSRFYTQLNEDFSLFKMGMAYLTIIRGIPQFYYGSEVLMTNRGTESHGIIRSDFPGGWEKDTINAFTGKGLSPLQLEAQTFVKHLLNWRKKNSVIHYGKLKHFAPEFHNTIYTLCRYNNDKGVVLILNKNQADMTVNIEKYLDELPFDPSNAINVLTGKPVVLSNKEIKIKGRSFALLELEN
ncbi:MAG: cyclomaltodextrinase N-terminal domain-containing protein [Bacteroidales bacterium]|nr:cyclomaltodextrinase N-terminal domain-containing protein [Bacteroidales bacterium]